MSRLWPNVKLGDVLRLYDNSVPVEELGEINLAGVYSFGRGLFKRGSMSPTETSYKTYNRLVADDFVISRPKAWEGALARVTPEFEGWYLSPVFPTFRADRERLDPTFLEWFCKQENVWSELVVKSRGIGARRESVSPEQFLSLEIPLPPLAEQQRIVKRIEEIAAKIAEARSLRHHAIAEAEALLMASRSDAILNCEADAISLGDCCTAVIDNLHSNPRYSETGSIPCVRSPDVGYGTLNLEGALRTDENEYRRRTVRGKPIEDDIVLVREGGGTGKCALVLKEQRFSLGQRVMMLRLNQQRVLPRFFLHQMLSPLVQEKQIGPLCKGSASPHLNVGALRGLHMQIPPLTEQQRIVAYLDSLQSKVDALKKLQGETSAELDALMPSLLDKAFKGKL